MTFEEFRNDWLSSSPTLTVHTSGSTGKPKCIRVEKTRMANSARLTCRFLGLKAGDSALLCLPLDYIAGKMMAVRAMVYNLSMQVVPPTGHPLREVETPPVFAAMVPMQVFQTLQVPAEAEKLQRIRHLIIGGGAIDARLEAQLKQFPNAVWSTYGMTETLSHIALRRLNGPEASSWYTPFDTVRISISPDGCLVIDAPEVCPDTLVTNDCVEIAPDGRRFRILGRKDNVVCSGGIKIQIEALEEKLVPHFPAPFMLTSVPDERLGEALVLLTTASCNEAAAHLARCTAWLPRYQTPRHCFSVEKLPYTETGKPARAEAKCMAETCMQKG